MSFVEDVRTAFGRVLDAYELKMGSHDGSQVSIVLSSVSVMMLLFHPSHGGLDMRIAVRSGGVWRLYAANTFLWRKSQERPNPGIEPGRLLELKTMVWKLEQSGTDMLRGEVRWTEEYEQRLGRPTAALPETAEKLQAEVSMT